MADRKRKLECEESKQKHWNASEQQEDKNFEIALDWRGGYCIQAARGGVVFKLGFYCFKTIFWLGLY